MQHNFGSQRSFVSLATSLDVWSEICPLIDAAELAHTSDMDRGRIEVEAMMNS